MSIAKRPVTIKELKAALVAYRDSLPIQIFEDADLSKLPDTLTFTQYTALCEMTGTRRLSASQIRIIMKAVAKRLSQSPVQS